MEAYEARLARCRHALEKMKQASALNPLAMERVCHWKMPLTMSNWAVDLIVLLEENQIPARTVLRALDIVKRDYEKKLTRDDEAEK